MNYRPISDYVIIKPLDLEKKTTGGIILPDSVSEKHRPREGRIIAIGNKVELDILEVGQKVLFKIWGGNIFKDRESEEEYLAVLEEDILAIIDEENFKNQGR